MAKNDYNVIVCIILSYMYKCLKDGKPVDVELMNPKTLGIPDNYWVYIVRHLAESNYIEGVACEYYKGGYTIRFDDDYFNITPEGIEYLQENDYMKKAKEIIKELASLTATLVKMGLAIANI